MDQRRARSIRWAVSLSAAVACNLLVITLLALTARPLVAPPALPAMQLDLSPDPTVTTRHPPPPPQTRAARTPPPPSRAVATKPAAAAAAGAVAASAAAPDGHVPTAPGEADAAAGSAQAAAAVRRLLACGGFGGRRRPEGVDCDSPAAPGSAHVDPLSPDRRAALEAEGGRQAELLATTRELQRETLPARGSAGRFGCNLKGGKWRCSTY